MLTTYYENDTFNPVLFCPSSLHRSGLLEEGADPHRAWSGDYMMSMAMFLSPTALDPQRPRWSSEYFIVQRGSDISFPSQKAELIDSTPRHDPAVTFTGSTISAAPWRLTVLACDGSGMLRHQRDSQEGIVFPEAEASGRPIFDGWSDTYTYTPFGVRGHDW